MIAPQCFFCRRDLPPREFRAERAFMILGSPCCRICMEMRTLYCHGCRGPLIESDFEEGRARRVLEKRFCLRCLREVLGRTDLSELERTEIRQALEHDPSPPVEKRAYPRFIPPVECRLALKPRGLGSLFSTNLVRHWLDVSAEGFRVVLGRKIESRTVLSGAFLYSPNQGRFRFTAEARYVRESRSVHGEYLAGFKLEEADRDVRSFIRTTLCGCPAIPIAVEV